MSAAFPQRNQDMAAVSAFLAMAVKESLFLNAHSARDTWHAWMRLCNATPQASSELLCRMLSSDEELEG